MEGCHKHAELVSVVGQGNIDWQVDGGEPGCRHETTLLVLFSSRQQDTAPCDSSRRATCELPEQDYPQLRVYYRAGIVKVPEQFRMAVVYDFVYNGAKINHLFHLTRPSVCECAYSLGGARALCLMA
jgi:hypothetical protein